MTLSVLLSGFGSGVLEDTVAVLVKVPDNTEEEMVPRMVRTVVAPDNSVLA